ncbi:hypothetical protein ACFLXC_06595 [Chloroflexota bacterium]
MPRKFENAKKIEWLELFEKGKSEKWIAHRAGCDVRTVKKAINDARLKRYVVVARVELVKDALRKHQDSLLEELDQIMSGLTVPQRDFAVLSWHHGEDSVFNEPDGQTKAESGGESSMRRLLKEHLKNDRLWRALGQWEKANAGHMAARTALQRRTAALLQEKTGYKLVDNDNTPPFVCSYTAGPLVYEAVTNLAFTAPGSMSLEKVVKRLENGIFIDAESGDIRTGNQILAVAVGNEQTTKQNLLDVFKDLAGSLEVHAVVETYQALEQITTKTRQVVEGIRLLGLVPGQCEICRRLGM